jgi:hypothetical protein
MQLHSKHASTTTALDVRMISTGRPSMTALNVQRAMTCAPTKTSSFLHGRVTVVAIDKRESRSANPVRPRLRARFER